MDPLRELQRLQRDINRTFSGFDSLLAVREYPALNVLQSGQDIIVTAELPGINPDKLNISVVNDSLTLSGSRDPEVLKESEVYHRQERNYGHFSRTINLPFAVDTDKVDASYKKGILTITLPRAEKEKPKKITIKAT
ncbi:MAG TPA: Hsp20/alpha crystallin family protein [Syntrophales bacterium]|nr:Hsp20/alpha crystallin family protein [Syntrophales bacterium]